MYTHTSKLKVHTIYFCRITFNRAKDLANKFKITDILYPLFVEDPSVFLSVPPPPPAAGTTTTATGSNSVLPIMLPSATSAGRGGSYYNSKNESASFGSFNLQSWEKQSYQSLPSITNGQQDQSRSFICLFISHPYSHKASCFK